MSDATIILGCAIIAIARPAARHHNAVHLRLSRREVVEQHPRRVLAATLIYVLLGAVFICSGLGLIH